MIRPRVSFLPWFLILAASAAFFLAGCMPKPVLDPGADPARQAFVEFRGHFLAPKPPPALLLRGSFTYTAPKPRTKTNRTVMLFFGDLNSPLRLDVQSGVGTSLAFIRESSEGLLAFYPDRRTAYKHWDPVVGAQRLGLPFPFALRDLAHLVSGDFSPLVSPIYDSVREIPGSGFEYRFSRGRVHRLVLDFMGQPQSMSGPLTRPPREDGTKRENETWLITFESYAPDGNGTPLCSILTLDLPDEEKGVLRIKSRELKLQPWPQDALGLPLPDGTEIRRLDREEAPRVLEMDGTNGGGNPAAPAGEAPR
ncbi:MAG TPA: hypothetical protein PKB11_15070 [Desulfovibrio sp.]|jgi:hypothetical protein|uniref:hypothetical protein n=2 Tax=Desulfovibrionaceae TaxID=194924 RepID=UPI002A436F98|nr:hypothetical protein [Desulfovibrio sp.]MDY0305701.1 hypothetical protein [Desulfovibrionaceae bacterium]HMM40078.1 hypothetical protein [Desulfovibrio sp.]